ncbi:MAG: Crp/Fnr family transcriptional regulator [Acidobacteriota bacterium]|nr:MAG: Crp/Fnr family transcriptional regulator [Acidobacteriota bacterium]
MECSTCQARGGGIFAGLGDAGLRLLEQIKFAHVYQRKQGLFYEGQPVAGVYCVRSGQVKVFKSTPEGKQYILRIAQEGDVLGLEALFSSAVHSCSAEVLVKGVICFVDRAKVTDLVHSQPLVARHVMETLSRRLQESDAERIELAERSVKERMARLFAVLAQSHGVEEGDRVRIDLLLSREELAEMIGAAPESAMRALAEFKRERLIQARGREISILDLRGLVRAAHLLDR